MKQVKELFDFLDGPYVIEARVRKLLASGVEHVIVSQRLDLPCTPMQISYWKEDADEAH